jgi:hypothetical protein
LYEEFLTRYPRSVRVPEAREKIAALKSKQAASVAPTVASLMPSDQTSQSASKSDQISVADIPRLLTVELRRVGCMRGINDGSWNIGAQRSLSLFNDHAGTTFEVKVASLDALNAVRSRKGRVCPLICEHGYRIDGDKCMELRCERGFQLNDENNSCERISKNRRIGSQKATASVEPASQPARTQGSKHTMEALYAQCSAEGHRLTGSKHKNVGFRRIEARVRETAPFAPT